jgi:hypothetical protein
MQSFMKFVKARFLINYWPVLSPFLLVGTVTGYKFNIKIGHNRKISLHVKTVTLLLQFHCGNT